MHKGVKASEGAKVLLGHRSSVSQTENQHADLTSSIDTWYFGGTGRAKEISPGYFPACNLLGCIIATL